MLGLPVIIILTCYTLSLKGSEITDAGLALLMGLVFLHTFDLEQTRVTDVGLRCLKGLVKLRNLNIPGTAVKAIPDVRVLR
jgi:hypothetical protein